MGGWAFWWPIRGPGPGAMYVGAYGVGWGRLSASLHRELGKDISDSSFLLLALSVGVVLCVVTESSRACH